MMSDISLKPIKIFPRPHYHETGEKVGTMGDNAPTTYYIK